jgi:tetratricopeptide (TPR) repeat protein
MSVTPRILTPLCLCIVLASPFAHGQATTVQTQGQAVDQSVPPPVVDPRTLSEKDRRAYADTLREARRDIDRKDFATAIAALDKLIVAHPREPQARFMKGLAQADAGRREEAMSTFRALLADYPELPEPRNNLAVLLAQKGEYALAREELEIALRAAPDYAVAHENLADVYARLAADHYERTAELDKRNKTAAAKLKLVREATATAAP